MTSALHPPIAPDPGLAPEAVVSRPRKEKRRDLAILIALTVLAILLRAFMIDRPTLRDDEVAAWMRVTGDAIVSPWLMRLIPLLAGALVVPAIFLSAKQLTSNRTALVAAAFAACSGWLLARSREVGGDAIVILLVTLLVTALLSAARTRRTAAWIALAASAVSLTIAMVAFRPFSEGLAPVIALRSLFAVLTGTIWPVGIERLYVPAVAIRWMVVGIVLVVAPLLLGLIPWPRQGGCRPNWRLALALPAWILLASVTSTWLGRGALLFAFPAVALVASLLLMRLPLAPLRWTVVALVLLANIATFVLPLLAQVEPPVDQIARDAAATRVPAAPPMRVYVNGMPGFKGPGGGSVFNDVGRYYLALHGATIEDLVPAPSAAALLDDLSRSPQLERIIVWDQISQVGGMPPETLESKLPSDWRLISTGHRPVWSTPWQYRYTARRREYVRTFAPPVTSN